MRAPQGLRNSSRPIDAPMTFPVMLIGEPLLIFMPTMLPATSPTRPSTRPRCAGLKKIHTGKVRDIYEIDADSMLIVTTDRLSAFDVVLPDPDSRQGPRTQLHLELLVRAHAAHRAEPSDRAQRRRGRQRSGRPGAARGPRRHRQTAEDRAARGRGARLRHRFGLEGLPEDRRDLRHQTTGGAQAGGETAADPVHAVDQGRASATHDETISFEQAAKIVGADTAARVRDTAIALYEFAAQHARERGIIIADTKFEFAHGPDGGWCSSTKCSRPIPRDSGRRTPGAKASSPPSFDKQFVRDYLETLDWNKKAPGPKLPPEVIAKTSANYLEALKRLTK